MFSMMYVFTEPYQTTSTDYWAEDCLEDK